MAFTDVGAHPVGRACCADGAAARTAFSIFAIRLKPLPAADNSKMRRMTTASTSLIRRSTCECWPFGPTMATLSYPKHLPPVTWPALAFRVIVSIIRWRAFSRSISSAIVWIDSMTFSMGESSVRSRSSR